jgi:hypothetical protein
VHSDACVEVDTNCYSVPWKWIGHQVRVLVVGAEIRIHHGEQVLAVHPQCAGRQQRSIQAGHLEGIVGTWRGRAAAAPAPSAAVEAPPASELLRPLSHDEAVVGGGWQ